MRQETVGRLDEFRASHTVQGVNASSFFFLVEQESVNEGHLDEAQTCINVAITARGGVLKFRQ